MQEALRFVGDGVGGWEGERGRTKFRSAAQALSEGGGVASSWSRRAKSLPRNDSAATATVQSKAVSMLEGARWAGWG